MRDKLTNCCCLTKYNTIHASCHAPIYVGLPMTVNDIPRLELAIFKEEYFEVNTANKLKF